MKAFKINPIPSIQVGRNIHPKNPHEFALVDLSYRVNPDQDLIVNVDKLDELSDFERRHQGLALLSQLMELYTYPELAPPLGVLTWSGIEHFFNAFLNALEGEEGAMGHLGYATAIGQIVTAQTGYGLSHYLGEALAKETGHDSIALQAGLVAELTELQVRMLAERLPDGESLEAYVMIGEAIGRRPFETAEEACANLVGTLRRWTNMFEIEKVTMTTEQIDRAIETLNQMDVLFWTQMRIEHSEILKVLKRKF